MVGQITSELSNRAILNHWKKLMLANDRAGTDAAGQQKKD